MRVLVCGGSGYRHPEAVYAALDALDGVTCVIEGGAPGADSYAAEWATMTGTAHVQFPANWRLYGRAAGPIRNRQMLDEGKPDLVLAFPGGRGTANMVKQARAVGVRVCEQMEGSDMGTIERRGCVHCDGEFRVNMGGENLCQHHADEWVRGEGMAANEVVQDEGE